jgi:hypothetical protein
MLGLIVIHDGTEDAKRAEDFARALAPTPSIVVEESRLNLTSTEAVRGIVLVILEMVLDEMEDG